MTKITISKIVTLVTGDFTIDWNLARSQTSNESAEDIWRRPQDDVKIYRSPGGAALLSGLMTRVANDLSRVVDNREFAVRSTMTPSESVSPKGKDYHHSYAAWSPFPYGTAPSFRSEPEAWRVREFLGLDRTTGGNVWHGSDFDRDANEICRPSLVMVNDSNMGFRDQAEEAWPKAIRPTGVSSPKSDPEPWILLKMTQSVAKGKLWDHLYSNCSERLVVVTSINDLRSSEAMISQGLSWERLAQDIVTELLENPKVNSLSRCAYTIVSLHTAGALLISRPQSDNQEISLPKFTLIFDPSCIEGTWAEAYPGRMIGYTTCLAGGIARQFLLSPDKPCLEQGVQDGLRAMRKLHVEGYGIRGTAAPQAALEFPSDLIATELAEETKPFAQIDLHYPFGRNSGPPGGSSYSSANQWSILQLRYPKSYFLEALARQVALLGEEKVLEGVPIGRFGKLLTVDRNEIESYRTLGNLIQEYCRQQPQRNPLSIAVFGAPGSGKSFGITEVARSLLPNEIKDMTFNLSQFNGPGDLHDTLHQVRDARLSGYMPLVFWDEFDTTFDNQPLGWLRHFLAPMQDGSFLVGQVSHPIGPSIFVFAGGTRATMERFAKDFEEDGPKELKEAKGTDFISRLKGSVNVLGPNPIDGNRILDPHFVLRRAILLRSILARIRPHFFTNLDGTGQLLIDTGVLRGFLETSKFSHGIRSMEAIIAMSTGTSFSTFERSSLPPMEQLRLHVEDPREFISLVQRLELDTPTEKLEDLAKRAHEQYRFGMTSRGDVGPWVNTEYEDLPEYAKEQNRDTVRNIPDKLIKIGVSIIPSREGAAVAATLSDSQLEELAQLEHLRWIRSMIRSGWNYNATRDDALKHHWALLPWDENSWPQLELEFTKEELSRIGKDRLSEKLKDQDRDLVGGIPELLEAGGYDVVRLSLLKG